MTLAPTSRATVTAACATTRLMPSSCGGGGGGAHDVEEGVDGLRPFELGDDRRLAAQRSDARPGVGHVGGVAHERQGQPVRPDVHGHLEILQVSYTHLTLPTIYSV